MEKIEEKHFCIGIHGLFFVHVIPYWLQRIRLGTEICPQHWRYPYTNYRQHGQLNEMCGISSAMWDYISSISSLLKTEVTIINGEYKTHYPKKTKAT